MTASTLARHYKHLTGEERFRLVLAASGRGDEAERDRLARSGAKISLSLADHAPWSQSFSEMSLFQYIDLLNEAGRYLEMFARADQPDEDEQPDDADRWADTTVEVLPEDVEAAAAGRWEEDGKPRVGFNERWLRTALAFGFALRTKADGWLLFCERLNVPPYLLWEALPGYDRLQAALKLARRASFTEVGFVRWLNEVRPAGDPEITRCPVNAEAVAADNDKAYRDRAGFWGA